MTLNCSFCTLQKPASRSPLLSTLIFYLLMHQDTEEYEIRRLLPTATRHLLPVTLFVPSACPSDGELKVCTVNWPLSPRKYKASRVSYPAVVEGTHDNDVLNYMACWIETEKGIWWRGEFTVSVNKILRNVRRDRKRKKKETIEVKQDAEQSHNKVTLIFKEH